MRTKDLVLSALFASFWASSQYLLGPYLGRISIGPISLHGSANRIAGWFSMTVLSSITEGFGPTTLMSAVAAIATRPLRVQQLEGIIVGLGYFVGGLTYDVLKNALLQGRDAGTRGHLFLSLASALAASAPYLLYNLYFLGPLGFTVFAPAYSISVARTTLLSIFGTSLGILCVRSLQLIKQFAGRRGPYLQRPVKEDDLR